MNINNLSEELLTVLEHLNDYKRADMQIQLTLWQNLSQLLRTATFMRRYQENYFRTVGKLRYAKADKNEELKKLKKHYLIMSKEYEEKLDNLLKSLLEQKKNFDIQFNNS